MFIRWSTPINGQAGVPSPNVSSRKSCGGGRAERGDGRCATRRVWCVISGLRACLLCSVIAGAGVVAETDADASLQDALAAALEANERLARLAEGQ